MVLVRSQKVQWVEASNAVDGYNWKFWMPDPSQTGTIDVSDSSIEGVSINLETVGSSDVKLSGTITLPAEHDLTQNGYWAGVNVIDADTGNWLGDGSVETNGSYSVNVGEVDGTLKAIIRVEYSFNDYNNWENSYWKAKFIDFGSDNALGTTGDSSTEDTLLSESRVQWIPKEVAGQSWDAWVPDVNHLVVNASVSGIDADMTTTSGGNINGTITGLSGLTNPYVYVSIPGQYNGVWKEMKSVAGNYTFKVEELDDAQDYTIEVGFEKDNKWYNFFVDGNDTVGYSLKDGRDIEWKQVGDVWGPSADDVLYYDIAAGNDNNLTINYVATQYNTVNIELNNVENGSSVEVNFFIPNKPFGRWENTTADGTSASFSFDDVKDGSAYILSFYYDGAEYTCDGTCSTLVKYPEWIAYDDNNNNVCGGDAGWDCDWDNSNNWKWMPEVDPITISGDTNISATIPTEPKVSGQMNLDSEYTGQQLYVNIFRHNGNDWNWADFTLDENGDVNGSIKVAGGSDYRIELWVDGLGGYVYAGNNTWINQNNSWEENATTFIWEPKPSTLIDITSDLDLGEIVLGSGLSKVNIEILNLDTESGDIVEEVWVSLESNTQGYYGEGNANWDLVPVTYDGNITLKVPNASDYRLLVFPYNHNGGFASDGDGTPDETDVSAYTKLSWDEEDYLNVNGDTNVTVTLPSAASLGDVNGTVDCGNADCSGWINVFNETEAKGTSVKANGVYSVKGLSAGDYDITYWSNTSNLILESNVTVIAEQTVTEDLAKSGQSVFSDISGDINDTSAYAVLIKTDGTTWEVIATSQVDSGDGSFSFGEVIQPVATKTYLVGAAKRTFNANGSSSVKFVPEENMVDVVSGNSIDTSGLNFGTTLDAGSINVNATATE